MHDAERVREADDLAHSCEDLNEVGCVRGREGVLGVISRAAQTGVVARGLRRY